MDLGLNGRVFVVTGGSRGLGRAGAQALVAEGAKVVLTSRSASAVEATVAELGADNAVGLAVDNADPATASAVVERARAAFGRLDGALLSVGGPPPGAATAVGDEQWRAAFDSVFLGAVRLATAISAALIDGGALALVLSTSVRQPVDGLAISNGLRPGLAMFAKTLADEVGPRGVRVVSLLPGRLQTDRINEVDAASGDAAASRAAHESRIPLRRYGDPAEFGRVAAFVLSPAASYLTGVAIPVDGGATRAL